MSTCTNLHDFEQRAGAIRIYFEHKISTMKLQTLFTLVFLSSILTEMHGQKIVPFSDKRWKIEGQAQLIEFYKGYECIYLRGARATLNDVQFLNGIIEFDICLTEQAAFAGVFFRQTDPANSEEFYFRAHQSGNPDAYQYTPVFNGDPAWQLYHDQFEPVCSDTVLVLSHDC